VERSYALEQAAKTTLFAAENRVGSRKNRQETIFSNQRMAVGESLAQQRGPSGNERSA
jgi:hypothetical protein